jgi:hypothetical protein
MSLPGLTCRIGPEPFRRMRTSEAAKGELRRLAAEADERQRQLREEFYEREARRRAA